MLFVNESLIYKRFISAIESNVIARIYGEKSSSVHVSFLLPVFWSNEFLFHVLKIDHVFVQTKLKRSRFCSGPIYSRLQRYPE